MTLEHTDPIAAQLASLTRWESGDADSWRAALVRVRGPRRNVGPFAFFNRRIPSPVLTVAAVLILSVVLAGLMLPSLGRARSSARPVAETQAHTPDSVSAQWRGYAEGMTGGYKSEDGRGRYGEAERFAGLPPADQSGAAAPEAARTAELSDRQVIRKATIELKTADVRATFLKAALVLSEANSEYLEQSSLTGQDASLQGTLTLRITASRLSSVLSQLRELGVVTSEAAGGEDVTDVIVDVEARLRNEQRVEAELLALLDSRNDAPLKEILELRESINRVRENIERMTAQRERLGRLVALATVLVIIRAEDAPAPVAKSETIGAYFLERITDAWSGSLRFLADSAAVIVRLVVGGLFWWVPVAAVVIALLSAKRRAARRAAEEPAPPL